MELQSAPSSWPLTSTNRLLATSLAVLAKKCTRHLRSSKFGAIAGDYVTVRSMAFCEHRSILPWKTRENRHPLGFQLPPRPDTFTVPEHPGLVLYPSGGPYHQYTVLSSILKQWGIWPPKGSNLQGFGLPPPPGPSFCPPKTGPKMGPKLWGKNGPKLRNKLDFRSGFFGKKNGRRRFQFLEHRFSLL